MFKTTRTIVTFFACLLSLVIIAQGNQQPVIIGKFKVIMAKCDGESFLWKKQDKMVSSGDVLIIRGDYVDTNSYESTCRFEDRYQRVRTDLKVAEKEVSEVYSLKGIERTITCFNESAASEAMIPQVKKVPMNAQLDRVVLTKEDNKISAKLPEYDLCAGEVTLELDHDRY